MNDFIKQKIDAIAECIFHKIEKSTEDLSYGLYSGEFGSLLFLFYYSSYTKKTKGIAYKQKVMLKNCLISFYTKATYTLLVVVFPEYFIYLNFYAKRIL